MEVLKKIGYILFAMILVLLILPPALTNLMGKPMLWTAVRTYSMYPVITKGDMVFLGPVNEHTELKNGDIIAFSSFENGIPDWTLHRIVGGSRDDGFITKGDANELTDQAGNDYPPIRQEWIAGRVPVLGETVIKIPFIGLATLLLGENIKNPVILIAILGALALLLIVDEIFKFRKKRKKESLRKGSFYFFGGIIFAILIGSVMLMGSNFVTFFYGVGSSSQVLAGSKIGVMPSGTSKEIALASVTNKGLIPSFYYVITDDPQITVDNERFFLKKGETKNINITITAEKEGIYESHITVAMFLPFFPPGLVYFIITKNYWLGLILFSFITSIPFYIIPYLDYKYRTRFLKSVRKKFSLSRQ